jgi:hypothetical protein
MHINFRPIVLAAVLIVAAASAVAREATPQFLYEVTAIGQDGRPYTESFGFAVTDQAMADKISSIIAGKEQAQYIGDFEITPGNDSLSINYASPRRPQWGWRVVALKALINISEVRLPASEPRHASSPSAIAANPADWISRNGSFYAPVTGRFAMPLSRDGKTSVINLSARVMVGSGEGVAIGGFVVAGDAPRTLLFRGIGPSLAAYGIAAPLTDPSLRLYRGPVPIAENNDWGDLAAAIVDVVPTHLRPLHAKESLLMLTLAPGAYTAILSSSNGVGGIGMVEVYDLELTGY